MSHSSSYDCWQSTDSSCAHYTLIPALLGATESAQIVWHHAVNSMAALIAATSSDEAIMLETDVIDVDERAVLGHDRENASADDVSLYLTAVSGRRRVGIKLDFKSQIATSVTANILRTMVPSASSTSKLMPLCWMNADICRGPNGGVPRFAPDKFISDICAVTPHAVMSLGWTTAMPTEQSTQTHYDEEMIAEMLLICKQHALRDVTFPLRASYVPESWKHGTIQQLLQASDKYSLTIWTSIIDERLPTAADTRAWLYAHLPKERTFFDLNVA